MTPHTDRIRRVADRLSDRELIERAKLATAHIQTGKHIAGWLEVVLERFGKHEPRN